MARPAHVRDTAATKLGDRKGTADPAFSRTRFESALLLRTPQSCSEYRRYHRRMRGRLGTQLAGICDLFASTRPRAADLRIRLIRGFPRTFARRPTWEGPTGPLQNQSAIRDSIPDQQRP